MTRTAAAVLGLLAVGGCPAVKPESTAPPPIAISTDVITAAKGTIEQWRQAYEVRSMDALGKLYAHDPNLVVVLEGTAQFGWSSIEITLRERLNHATSIHVRIKDVQVIGLGATAAVATASMQRERAEGATTATENGTLMLVLRKDDAGWVIVAEHYSYKRPT